MQNHKYIASRTRCVSQQWVRVGYEIDAVMRQLDESNCDDAITHLYEKLSYLQNKLKAHADELKALHNIAWSQAV